MNTVRVRPFVGGDVPELVRLMRELAVLEGYVDDFAVTEADVIEAGLRSAPAFGVLVAESDAGTLLGMAVHYVIPWTYDLKPALVLKELFVKADARGLGVGAALMTALVDEGRRIGASRISWTVMAGNDGAAAFYRSLGARPALKWQPWSLPLDPQRSVGAPGSATFTRSAQPAARAASRADLRNDRTPLGSKGTTSS